MGFRPQMSDSFAQIGAAAAFARRYAPPIHMKPKELWSRLEMVGIAVAMMVWSKAAINSENWIAIGLDSTVKRQHSSTNTQSYKKRRHSRLTPHSLCLVSCWRYIHCFDMLVLRLFLCDIINHWMDILSGRLIECLSHGGRNVRKKRVRTVR